MDAKTFLKNVPIFSGLGSSDLSKIRNIGKVQKFKKGQLIFDENTAGNYFFVVIFGSVKIYASSQKKRKTLAYLSRGEFFGEMALLDAEKRSASSRAQEDCELLVINKKDFRKLLVKYPNISFLLMKALSCRLRQANRDIEALSFENVIGRVAKALLDISEKYGVNTPLGRKNKINVNQEEIAELAGTSREMVSRMLNRMRRLKVISYDKQQMTITNMQKLREWV